MRPIITANTTVGGRRPRSTPRRYNRASVSADSYSRLRNGSDRIHHTLDDGWLADGADLESRGKAIVKRTLGRHIPIGHRRGADSCGPAAEAPPQLIHLVRGCRRCVGRRSVIDDRLDRLDPPALGSVFARRRLNTAGMIFAHRRKPALDPLMIGLLHGPGRPSARIFLPNSLRRGQAL